MTASTRRITERLPPDGDGPARAAALLRGGGLVAFPTETVYGLGADGRNADAVASLYAAKGRPRFNPLIAHVAGPDEARREGAFGPLASRLADAFWPGPLTLVVPVATTATVCELARAGLGSIGLRVPSHPSARAVMDRCGFPLVAPSANRSGRISPTAAADVLNDLDGLIDAVLEGGPAEIGVESTIVSCLGEVPRLLRPGGVPRQAIEAVLGRDLAPDGDDSERPLAPGGLASHYAPRALLRLDVTRIGSGEAALLFGPARPDGLERAATVLNLSPAGSTVEAASNLYRMLREADARGVDTIAVAPIPGSALGEAINDRLRRAAAPRLEDAP